MLQPDRPLPPYPYTPGTHPHPTRHPDGHSFHHTEPEPVLPDPDAWGVDPDHRHACDLFNNGYYWEAHEAWEHLWHLTEKASPEWHALRGLIQAAAYRLKRAMGHKRAADVLLAKATANLQAATRDRPMVLALDCARLARALSSGSVSVIPEE